MVIFLISLSFDPTNGFCAATSLTFFDKDNHLLCVNNF